MMLRMINSLKIKRKLMILKVKNQRKKTPSNIVRKRNQNFRKIQFLNKIKIAPMKMKLHNRMKAISIKENGLMKSIKNF